jgi:DNA-binding GntR family transcriptional regulator
MVTPPPADRRKVFVRIADELRQDIAAGRYPIGEPFPSIGELVDRFGSAKATVGRAVDVLRGEGLLATRQGSRTVVVAIPDQQAEEIEPEAYSEEFRILFGYLREIHDQMRTVLTKLENIERRMP